MEEGNQGKGRKEVLTFLFILDGEKQFLPPKSIIKLLIDVPFLLLGELIYFINRSCSPIIFIVMCNIVVVAALGFFSPTMSTFLQQQVRYQCYIYI